MFKDFLTKLISPITSIIDKAVVDKDLKKKLKIELEELILTHAQKAEEELTKRHELDMKSDSWLSKNVRPMSLIFLMAVYTLFAFGDGNIGEFTVNSAYTAGYQTMLTTVFMFYFGSRGAEKVAKIINDRKN